MYTNFTVSALLAATALARGRSDGSSRWNSIPVTLIENNRDCWGQPDTRLTLEYYYDNEEFHGDLILEFPTTGLEKTVIFGFCFADDTGLEWPPTRESKTQPIQYDCLEAEYVIDPAAIELAQTDELADAPLGDFKVFDMYSTNQLWQPLVDLASYPQYDDDKYSDDADLNWRLSASKSNAVGCKFVNGSSPQKFTCESLQVHFFRKWSTEQPTQDNQITDQSLEWLTKGFVTQQATKNARKFNFSNFITSSHVTINPTQAKEAANGRTQQQKNIDEDENRDERTGVFNPIPVESDTTESDTSKPDITETDITGSLEDIVNEYYPQQKVLDSVTLAQTHAQTESSNTGAYAGAAFGVIGIAATLALVSTCNKKEVHQNQEALL